jgi:catechol 2,3-dioxygenase-like lactoylglutathione lyase family enzyme
VPKKRIALKGMTVTRLLPNICTDRMAETRDFYAGLLGFVVGFEHHGWYIQMASPTNPQLQIGIVRRDHEVTPKGGFRVAHELRDESFSMRRFMVADPNGLLVNIFSFP